MEEQHPQIGLRPQWEYLLEMDGEVVEEMEDVEQLHVLPQHHIQLQKVQDPNPEERQSMLRTNWIVLISHCKSKRRKNSKRTCFDCGPVPRRKQEILRGGKPCTRSIKLCIKILVYSIT